MELKLPDPDLERRCTSYLLEVEPAPEGAVLARGNGLVPGLAKGEVSPSGPILHLTSGERPSIDLLALAQAVVFSDPAPDADLLALCRNVGIAAIGGIEACPRGTLVLDGLRGTLHEDGPVREFRGGVSWEEKIVTNLPVPVWAAVDDPEDVFKARRRGAAGIGLVRTEHVCQTPDLLPLLQQLMLLEAGPLAERRAQELAEGLAPRLRTVFDHAPAGPILVRLLDPPPHEFLDPGILTRLQTADGPNFRALFEERDSIAPTLVLRGLRGHWRQPAFFSVIFTALDKALSGHERAGDLVITLPMVTSREEVDRVRILIGEREWQIGAMIETPVALVSAGNWLDRVDHVTFGGNDLTQNFWGLSRDDRTDLWALGREELIGDDPFEALGPEIRPLIANVLDQAAATGIESSFCGRQATDPDSARFLVKHGITALTCDVDSLVPLRLELSGAGP